MSTEASDTEPGAGGPVEPPVEAPDEPEALAEEAEPEAADATAKPSKKSRFVARARFVFEWMRDHYCRMDPRTAGIFRIVLGFLCATDTIRHWSVARRFYSNEGVLTNHYHLFRPSSGYNFSVYHAFSSINEVHVAFAISVLCHLCLMIGWRSRLFAVVSFILMTSIDNRLVMVENGGYIVVNLITAYAMFMPIERRFSVDALLRSYRERKERTVADVNERYRPAWATDSFVSIGVLLVVLNLAIVYFFNVVNKSGTIWKQGLTVHYVLHLNRMVTGLAVFFRDILPLWATRGLTWAVLMLEALLIPWIMAPKGRRITRSLALVGIFLLHATFGVMMRLGPFSWFLIGWSMLLIAPEQWDLAERWYRRRAKAVTLVYDRSSALAFALVRLLSRLDRLELITFEESAEGESKPALVSVNDGERTVTDAAALGAIAQALPGGKYAFPVLRVLSLGLVGPVFSALAARREGAARFLGLSLVPKGKEVRDEPSPLRLKARWARVRFREAFLVYFAICAVYQAIDENKSVPPFMKPNKPKFVDATLGYPRLYQGWGMFAPNPITDDGSISVKAWTIDGRLVDPFTGEEPDLDLTDARGLGLGQIQQDYFNRIRLDRNQVYRQGLSEYLRRYHLETGNPKDELVGFDVYWLRDQCPKPGDKKAYDNEVLPILAWRKPGFRPPPGFPPMPPEPQLVSAEVKPSDKTEAKGQDTKPMTK